MFSTCLSCLQEIYYYVNQGNQVREDNSTSDKSTVKVVDKGNKELVEALTSEGGVLAAGVVPAPGTDTAEGQKALLDSLGTTVEPSSKKKPKPNKTPTEEAEPKTFEQNLAFDIQSFATYFLIWWKQYLLCIKT